MLERLKRRISSERGSVFLEHALVTAVTLGLAALLINPDSQLFTGLGFDYEFREALIKLPIL